MMQPTDPKQIVLSRFDPDANLIVQIHRDGTQTFIDLDRPEPEPSTIRQALFAAVVLLLAGYGLLSLILDLFA